MSEWVRAEGLWKHCVFCPCGRSWARDTVHVPNCWYEYGAPDICQDCGRTDAEFEHVVGRSVWEERKLQGWWRRWMMGSVLGPVETRHWHYEKREVAECPEP